MNILNRLFESEIIPTLLGIIIGSVITYFFGIKLKKNEMRLKIVEKFVDMRIRAHETIHDFSRQIMMTSTDGDKDIDGIIISFPLFLIDDNTFYNWKTQFITILRENAHWVNSETMKELNLMQEYLLNLGERLEKIDSKDFKKVGYLIKGDIVEFSCNLEKSTFNFFTKGWQKFKISKTNETHYPRKYRLDRLNNSKLFSQTVEINKLMTKN
jgi:hypothetical protein